jgi:hypothetical protein
MFGFKTEFVFLQKTMLSVALRTLNLTVGRSYTSKVGVTKTHTTNIIIHGAVKLTVCLFFTLRSPTVELHLFL